MLKNPMVRLLVWSLSSFFFFIAAGLLISMASGATEYQLTLWMHGMEQVMHQGMMGIAMDSQEMQNLFFRSAAQVIPFVGFGILSGFIIRIWRGLRETN